MNLQSKYKYALPFFIGAVIVILLALKYASFDGEGLLSFIFSSGDDIFSIRDISFSSRTIPSVFLFLLVYTLIFFLLISGGKNRREGIEHGSASFEDPKLIGRKYMSGRPGGKIILTKNVSIGTDTHIHRRNLNVLVCGGSGAGKTRYFAKPNVMECAKDGRMSLFVTDPKGEILRSTGTLLKEKGYEIKVLDLISMDKSDGYNPFAYLKTDTDIQKLVTNLFESTTPKGKGSSDPFWDQAGMMLLMSLCFYLVYEAAPEDRNFSTILDLIRNGEINEDSPQTQSTLDFLFDDLEKRNPEHIALKYYRAYRSGSGKTLKSIQITLLARLEKFNLPSVASICASDDMELDKIGTRPTAVFAVIPDNDSSMSFLVSMLYTQLFQQLYYAADVMYGGALPCSVHLIMDEFANIALPPDFDKILSTMRSRGISASIILQNMSQLKSLYDKSWESIVGNCDSFLYLGGNEQSTHEYVSKLLGKETIDTDSYSKSQGRNGQYTKSYQRTGRELMSSDEVRLLSNLKALLFIRGEKAVVDDKYDISLASGFSLTTDGGAEPYLHTLEDYSVIDLTYMPHFDGDDESLVPFDETLLSSRVISCDDAYERLYFRKF